MSRLVGLELPITHRSRQTGASLHLWDFTFETSECDRTFTRIHYFLAHFGLRNVTLWRQTREKKSVAWLPTFRT